MLRGCIAVGIVALVVRVVALAGTDGLRLATDPQNYDLHARTLATTGHYPPSTATLAGGPSAIRPPGYPYLLAGIYVVSDDNATAGRVGQAVVGAGIAVLVALIAAELFGTTVGVVAGV